MEDNLKKLKKWKTTSKKKDGIKRNIFSQFLLDFGANLSWGWLGSLRFFKILSQSLNLNS
jgi:hypothetical protein